MAKRRTRKDKTYAQHPFLISWQDRPQKASDKASVKRHSLSSPSDEIVKSEPQKKAAHTPNANEIGTIKKDLGKSVAIASLIISIEVVLYLAWYKF